MKYKIGVYGSAAGDMAAALPKAKALGKALAGYSDQIIIITGACSGLPYAVIEAAAPSGIEIWGFSSSCDLAGQRREYPENTDIYNKLIYVPQDFPFAGDARVCKKYRNIMSTEACDVAIFISGRWGTLNEFTNLIDFRKPAGVLTGTGGIADELPALAKKIHKAGQGPVIFDDDPDKLIEKLLEEIKTKLSGSNA